MQKSYEMFGDYAVGLWPIGPKDLSLEELMNKIESLVQPQPTLAQQHHEFMAMNIESIKNGLKSFSAAYNSTSIHNSFTDDHFYGLAYEGLNGTSYYLNKVLKDNNGNLKTTDYNGTQTLLATVYYWQGIAIQQQSSISCN